MRSCSSSSRKSPTFTVPSKSLNVGEAEAEAERRSTRSRGFDWIRLLEVKFDANKASRGLVFDLVLGNLMKLNSRKKVVTASHGMRLMTDEETAALYPQPLECVDRATLMFVSAASC